VSESGEGVWGLTERLLSYDPESCWNRVKDRSVEKGVDESSSVELFTSHNPEEARGRRGQKVSFSTSASPLALLLLSL